MALRGRPWRSLSLRIMSAGSMHQSISGDKQLAASVDIQLYGEVLAPCGTSMAQVNYHVKDVALRDSHQLGLAPLAALEMQSAQHALA